MGLIPLTNNSSFLDRNSFDSVGDIIGRDAAELLRTMNVMKMTSPQVPSAQFYYTPLSFYIDDEENANEKRIEVLSKHIKFSSLTDEKRLLSKNAFLIDVIKEAITKIKKLFTSESLELAVENDPEIQSYSEVLVLKIHTKKNPKETIELLNKLDEEWWLEAKLNTKQKLIIEEEYD